ncbi:MAG: UTP--glucose-1-phosphate uridylyltransferase [Elusimicrobia bacterium]|nr:UTP--glucose-1-phosphate uridylyltransferase [Elusimicrobiota bacterium]
MSAYPSLNAYIAYALNAETIQREKLLDELNELERSAFTALATTETATRLVRARWGLALLEKLSQHALTPAEWAAYQKDRVAILRIPGALAEMAGEPRGETIPEDLLAPFEQFCAAALERNRALVDHLLKKMAAEKAATGILVAGGFHTAGLEDILEEKGVSFAVVSPRLARVSEPARPLDVFARAPLPLETLLAGDVIHLAYAPLTQAEGTVADVPQGPARRQTAEALWDSLDSFLAVIKTGFQAGDLSRFDDWSSGFKSIQSVGARPVKFRKSLDAVVVRLETHLGMNKGFVILAVPSHGEAPLPDAKPVYAGRFALESLEADIRIYNAHEIEPSDLGEVSWADGVAGTPGRLLAALRRVLNNRRLSREERRIEQAHLAAIVKVSTQNRIPQEKLLPIFEHIRRTQELARQFASDFHLPLDDKRILSMAAAAHDMGKFHEDCIESILKVQYHERGSPEHQALAAHEEAVFAMLDRYQLDLGPDASLVLRAHSAIGPLGQQDLSSIEGLEERHVRLALILAMADVGDGYRDMTRDYLRARVAETGFPDAAALTVEYNKYCDGALHGGFGPAAAWAQARFHGALDQDWFGAATERTLIDHVARSVAEAMPPSADPSDARRLTLLADAIQKFNLPGRTTPPDQWWPDLVERLWLRGARGTDRESLLKGLLSQVVEGVERGTLDDSLGLDLLTLGMMSPGVPLVSRRWVGGSYKDGQHDFDLFQKGMINDVRAAVPGPEMEQVVAALNHSLANAHLHGIIRPESPAEASLALTAGHWVIRVENYSDERLPKLPEAGKRKTEKDDVTLPDRVFRKGSPVLTTLMREERLRGVNTMYGYGTSYVIQSLRLGSDGRSQKVLWSESAPVDKTPDGAAVTKVSFLFTAPAGTPRKEEILTSWLSESDSPTWVMAENLGEAWRADLTSRFLTGLSSSERETRVEEIVNALTAHRAQFPDIERFNLEAETLALAEGPVTLFSWTGTGAQIVDRRSGLSEDPKWNRVERLVPSLNMDRFTNILEHSLDNISQHGDAGEPAAVLLVYNQGALTLTVSNVTSEPLSPELASALLKTHSMADPTPVFPRGPSPGQSMGAGSMIIQAHGLFAPEAQERHGRDIKIRFDREPRGEAAVFTATVEIPALPAADAQTNTKYAKPGTTAVSRWISERSSTLRLVATAHHGRVDAGPAITVEPGSAGFSTVKLRSYPVWRHRAQLNELVAGVEAVAPALTAPGRWRNEWRALLWRELGYRRAETGGTEDTAAPGQAIRLSGGGLSVVEHRRINRVILALIKDGKAAAVCGDRAGALKNDKDLKTLPVEEDTDGFVKGLRGLLRRGILTNGWPADFDLIVVDGDFPADVALHPGHRRHQAYLPRAVFDGFKQLFRTLPPGEDQDLLLEVVGEMLRHEAEHIRRFQESGRPASEAEVDAVASSARPRALLRVLHSAAAARAVGAAPRWNAFLERARGERTSYLHAYPHLTPEQHVGMATEILRRPFTTEDRILAQLHLGAVFDGAAPSSPVFNKALALLQRKNIVDLDPEIGKPFPLWKFVQELTRQHALISDPRPISEINVIAKSLAQFDPWTRGNDVRVGDSLQFPVPGQTMALPLTREQFKKKLTDLWPTLKSAERADLWRRVRFNPEGHLLITRGDLDWLGLPLEKMAMVSRSAAGKGTRYAREEYDEATGAKVVLDWAKGVYTVPLEEGAPRGILEIVLAQARARNLATGAALEVDVHTSHLTDSQIRFELIRLGYVPNFMERFMPEFVLDNLPEWLYTPGLYTHPAEGSAPVKVVRVREAHLLDARTGDFYKHSVPGMDVMDVMWPDAHDTSFIDFIVSGRAYEVFKQGKRFQFIANIDNLAALPSPALLAVMRLTGAPLLNELAQKPKGAKGASAVKFKAGRTSAAVDFGRRLGLAEEFQFDGSFLKGLSPEAAEAYFPMFNTANYVVDIANFSRQFFNTPDATEADVEAKLKRFYDARNDPEVLLALRFELIAGYRRQTQLWEKDKTHPALQPASLAGMVTWRVPTVFVEVPVGPSAGAESRFEPLKENIDNFSANYALVERLLAEGRPATSPVATLQTSGLSPADAARWEAVAGKYKGKTLGDIQADLAANVRSVQDSLKRVAAKQPRNYGAAEAPSTSAQPRAPPLEQAIPDLGAVSADIDPLGKLNQSIHSLKSIGDVVLPADHPLYGLGVPRDFEVHLIGGKGNFQFVFNGPFGRVRAHASGLTSKNSADPKKILYVARAYFDEHFARAPDHVAAELTKETDRFNKWWQATHPPLDVAGDFVPWLGAWARKLLTSVDSGLEGGVQVARPKDAAIRGEVVNIAYEGPFWGAGGVQDVVTELLPELVRQGVATRLFVPLHQGGVPREVRDQILTRGVEGVSQFTLTRGQETYTARRVATVVVDGKTFGVYETEIEGVTVDFIAHPELFPNGYEGQEAFWSNIPADVRQRVLQGETVDAFRWFYSGRDYDARLARVTSVDGRQTFVYRTNYADKEIDFAGSVEMFRAGRSPRDLYWEATLFSAASVRAMEALNLKPSVVQAHDWQAAQALAYVRGHAPTRPVEGRRAFRVAVSDRYAHELLTELGSGELVGIFREDEEGLLGIANGISHQGWDPRRPKPRRQQPASGENKPALLDYDYTPFSAADPEGKRENKTRMQEALGLTVDPAAPVFASAFRITGQKGVEEIIGVAGRVLHSGGQMVIQGLAHPEEEKKYHYVARLRELRDRFPGKMVFRETFNKDDVHMLLAGADFSLWPSEFEPCGVAHQQAMRYGAVPIGRRVGGLDTTIIDEREYPGYGTGLKFDLKTADSLWSAVEHALKVFKETPDAYNAIQKRTMVGPRDWSKVAPEYLDVYMALDRGEIRDTDSLGDAALITVIHNGGVAYQGRQPANVARERFEWAKGLAGGFPPSLNFDPQGGEFYGYLNALKIGLVAQNHARPLLSDALIGHVPAGVDLTAVPLQRAAEVKAAYSALDEWLATKLAGPPPPSANPNLAQAVWSGAQVLREKIGSLRQNTDLGVFDADGLQRHSQSRVLGYGFSQEPRTGGRGRLGLSDEFFELRSVLHPHLMEAAFHEGYHVVFGADAKTTHHLDAIRLQAVLFWGLSPDEAFALSLEGLENHPKNALGRALRVRRLQRDFRGEDIYSLATELRGKMAEGRLIPFLSEADDALHLPLGLSPTAMERRAQDRIDLMRRVEGEAPRRPGDEDPRAAEARRTEQDWAKPLMDSGPVEALHPLLKAISLLDGAEETRLLEELGAAVLRDAALADRPLVDRILLMTGRVPASWAKLHGIAYQRVYHLSAEGRKVWAGGLGPVQVFHSDAEREITRGSNVDIVDIEPDYTHRRTAEGLVLAAAVPPSTPLLPSDEPPFDLDVVFEDHPVKIRVRPMKGPEGNPVYLFRDNPDGDAFFTKQLYDYRGGGDNPASWEDFSAFFSVASLAIIAHLEEVRLRALGAAWRPPVIHGNDAQTALVNVLVAEAVAGGNPRAESLAKKIPFFKPLSRWIARSFKTHTYFNRQGYLWGRPNDHFSRLSFLSGIPEWDHGRLMGYFARTGPEGNGYPDVTSAGVAATPGHVQGVSRKHGWDVARKYDDPHPVVGITNGANLEWSAGLFRGYLKRVAGDHVDQLRPTAGQVRDAKRLAKEEFFTELLAVNDKGQSKHLESEVFERFRDVLRDRTTGTDARLDPALLTQPTFGFVGRLVNEKFNMDRAWARFVIRALVQAGVNVVLFAPIQQKSDPRSPSSTIALQLTQLAGNLDREWKPGHGRLLFIDSGNSELKKKALTSLDLLVLDSDKDTEANGYTEVAASASGALVMAPPFHNGEGLIRGQGIPIDWNQPGHGNTLIPENQKSDAYLDTLARATSVYFDRPDNFAAHQATSVRLSRPLEARLTAAASLRDFNLSYQLPVDLKTDARWRTGLVLPADAPVKIEALVHLRPGVGTGHLEARARLAPVRGWGMEWGAVREIPLGPAGGVVVGELGSQNVTLAADVDLPPGQYEFIIETRDDREPVWMVQEGISWGQNNRLTVGVPSAPAGLLPFWRPVIQKLRFLGWADRRIGTVLGFFEELSFMGGISLMAGLLGSAFGLGEAQSFLVASASALVLFPLGHAGLVHYYDHTGRLKDRSSSDRDVVRLLGFGAVLRAVHVGLFFALPWLSALLAGAPVAGPPSDMVLWAAAVLPFLIVPSLHARYDFRPPAGWPLAVVDPLAALARFVPSLQTIRYVPTAGVPDEGGVYNSNPQRSAILDQAFTQLVDATPDALTGINPTAFRAIAELALENTEQHGTPGAEASITLRAQGGDILLEVANPSTEILPDAIQGEFSIQHPNTDVPPTERGPGSRWGAGVAKIAALVKSLYPSSATGLADRVRWSWRRDVKEGTVVFSLRAPRGQAAAQVTPLEFTNDWQMPESPWSGIETGVRSDVLAFSLLIAGWGLRVEAPRAETFAVAPAPIQPLDPAVIEIKDFGSAAIPPGRSGLSPLAAPWARFSGWRAALNPGRLAIGTVLGALILLAMPDVALAAQSMIDGASTSEVLAAPFVAAAVAMGRPRAGVNAEKVESLFRSGTWIEVHDYLREMKSMAGRDPAAYVDGVCILMIRLLSLVPGLPEAERETARTELLERFWRLANSLSTPAVAGPYADELARNYMATLMLDNLAARALDTRNFDLAEPLAEKAGVQWGLAHSAAGNSPTSGKRPPPIPKIAEARAAIAHTRTRLAFLRGRYEEARAIATEALSAPDGAFQHPIQNNRDLSLELEFFIAESHAAEKHWDQAAEAFRRTQARAPGDPRAFTGEAVLHLERAAGADSLVENERLARQSLALLDQAAAKGDATIRHFRARLSAQLFLHELAPSEGHLAAAEAALPKAIALHPAKTDVARVWLNRWFGAEDFTEGFRRLVAARDAVLKDKKTQRPERVDFQFLGSMKEALAQLEAMGFDVSAALAATSVNAVDPATAELAADAAFLLNMRGEKAAFGRSLDALRRYLLTAANGAFDHTFGAAPIKVFENALGNLQRVSDVDWVVRTLVPRAAASDNKAAHNVVVEFLKANAEDVSVKGLQAMRDNPSVMAVRPFANFANLNWKRAQEQYPRQIGLLAEAPIADWTSARNSLDDARLLGVADKPGVQKLQVLWDAHAAELAAQASALDARAAEEAQRTLADKRPENLRALRDLRRRLSERRSRIIASQNPAMALENWDKSQELFTQAETLLAAVAEDKDVEIRRVTEDVRAGVRSVKSFYADKAKGPWRDAVTDQLEWEGNEIMTEWQTPALSESAIQRLTRESLVWVRLARTLLVGNAEDRRVVREESRKILGQARVFRPRQERGGASLDLLLGLAGVLALTAAALTLDRLWLAGAMGLGLAAMAARLVRRASAAVSTKWAGQQMIWDSAMLQSLTVDRRTTLDRVLLGGAAGPVSVGWLTADISRVRSFVQSERRRGQAARAVLEKNFGAWSLTDENGLLSEERVRWAGAAVAAASRREGGVDSALPTSAPPVFLALATLGEHDLTPAQWSVWAEVFAEGFNTGLTPAGKRLSEAVDEQRPLIVEISASMLSGAPTAQDETRLAELRVLLSRQADLAADQLTWVLPDGRKDLARLPRDLAGLRDIRAGVRVKSKIPQVDGKLSVKSLLLDVQGRARVADLAATDLFLMDRGEWVIESDLPKDLARLLIALAGGLVVDATHLLAEEVKNLYYLQTNA